MLAPCRTDLLSLLLLFPLFLLFPLLPFFPFFPPPFLLPLFPDVFSTGSKKGLSNAFNNRIAEFIQLSRGNLSRPYIFGFGIFLSPIIFKSQTLLSGSFFSLAIFRSPTLLSDSLGTDGDLKRSPRFVPLLNDRVTDSFLRFDFATVVGILKLIQPCSTYFRL